jgi:hypothetical protein
MAAEGMTGEAPIAAKLGIGVANVYKGAQGLPVSLVMRPDRNLRTLSTIAPHMTEAARVDLAGIDDGS